VGAAVSFLRYLGYALIAVGVSAAALAAVAGPFGVLRDLRHPMILAAVGYLIASGGAGRWVLIERMKNALAAPLFPWVLTLAASMIFVRIKILEWWSGAISGIDFSHLDYASWSTAQGRFMEIPIIADHPTYLDMFGNHYSPIMFIYVAARYLWDSPAATLVVHGLSLAMAIPVLYSLALKFVDRVSASLLVLTYVFCGSAAATLQFDIHHESFFVLGIGLIFLGAYSGIGWLLVGTLISLLIKEDAGLYVGFIFLCLAWFQPHRRWLNSGLALVSFAWLVFAVKVGMKWHQPEVLHTPAFYFAFWQRYGASYGEVARTMLTHPHWVLADLVLNPALYKNLLPWSFLPLASPLGLTALVPALVLSTASVTQRGFGLYYGIVLVPIFFTAAAEVLGRFQNTKRRHSLAIVMLGLSAFVGGSFLRFPQPSEDFVLWRRASETINKVVPSAQLVWVQSGLLPYLPYETRWRRIESVSSLPPAKNDALVFYRGLKTDSIEVPWERLDAKLAEHGYRKIHDDGRLLIFR
jgi:uncharacterized membrane protein